MIIGVIFLMLLMWQTGHTTLLAAYVCTELIVTSVWAILKSLAD